MSKNDQSLPSGKEKKPQWKKCYEEKDYKRGIKLADSILKDFPRNARALCMRSLLIYLINKDKEVAERDIKFALRLDPKNGTCWQTLGLFYRHSKNYAEARKAFQLASTYDPSNLQLIIDLAALHAQERDYAGFRSCHQKLIGQLPNRSNFWLGFMIGYYLEGKYSQCIDVIQTYRETLNKTPSIIRQELVNLESECLLALNKRADAIRVLRDGMPDIINEDAAKERLAILYGENNQLKESRALWEGLLKRNSENYRYFRGLECCVLNQFASFSSLQKLELLSTTGTLTEEQRETLQSLYKDLALQYPQSTAIQLIHLNLMNETEFATACNALIIKAIRKGIPSFFKSLRGMFVRSPSRYQIAKGIAENYYQSMMTTGQLIEGEEEEPSTWLWLLLLLAEFEDYENETMNAMRYLRMAYESTPTCYDLYMIRARVLKHAGALNASADSLAMGSSLDRGDRYMNTKLTKSLLRCNRIEKADTEVSYWTKKDTPSRIDLANMQACWYEIECGNSYWRQGDAVHANKLYHEILDHFDLFVLDQFDFHPYVLRKANIMSYLNFLKYTDNVYNHPYYIQAAIGAIRCAIAFDKLSEYYQSVNNRPFDMKDYLKHYKPIHLTGDIKKADEPDNDIDGFSLASQPRPLLGVMKVALRLLKIGTHDREAMEIVLAWGAAVKNMATVKNALNALMKIHALKAVSWAQKVVNLGLMKEIPKDLIGEKTVDEYIASADYTQMQSVIALGELKGVSAMMDQLKNVQRCTIEEWCECYCLLKRLEGTEEQKKVFMERATKFYLFFEEYLECNKH